MVLKEKDVLEKLEKIKRRNNGTFQGLPRKDIDYLWFNTRVMEVRIHLGTQDNKSGSKRGAWIQSGTVAKLKAIGFPVDKAVRAAPGTVTNGSREERSKYEADRSKEHRRKDAVHKCNYLAASAAPLESPVDQTSFDYFLTKNRQLCAGERNADELRGKPFSIQAHASLTPFDKFQRPSDGSFEITPYDDLSDELKEFTARDYPAGEVRTAQTWFGMDVTQLASWILNHGDNHSQVRKFVEDGNLIVNRDENGDVLIEIDVTIAFLNVNNVQNQQSIRQTRFDGVNVGDGCELLSRKKGPTNPDLVGVVRFVVWDSSQEGLSRNPSVDMLVRRLTKEAYELFTLDKRKSLTVKYANGDYSREINKDITDEGFSFTECGISYEDDRKPAAESVPPVSSGAIKSAATAPAAESAPRVSNGVINSAAIKSAATAPAAESARRVSNDAIKSAVTAPVKKSAHRVSKSVPKPAAATVMKSVPKPAAATVMKSVPKPAAATVMKSVPTARSKTVPHVSNAVPRISNGGAIDLTKSPAPKKKSVPRISNGAAIDLTKSPAPKKRSVPRISNGAAIDLTKSPAPKKRSVLRDSNGGAIDLTKSPCKPNYHGLFECGACGECFEFIDEIEKHRCK
eukprot:scaffold2251_cov73-Cyclotella_meneghiniana.AAC.13